MGPSLTSQLSVIIPARNEAHNLPVLLRSIHAQSSRPLEVIVVDDDSTDQTAALARDGGARVIASQSLPEGWRGKTWACQQGAHAASGNLLLFLDADTWFESEGLSKILAAYDGGAFSVGPYHAVREPYEQLSLFFNLNMTAGTVPDGLFGQMLLVDQQSYWQVGGHETVKGRVLENFWLAAQFRAFAIRVRSVTGRGLLSFRMYPLGLRELVAGWIKGFAAGAGRTPRGKLVGLVLWMSVLILPVTRWPLRSWSWVLYALCAAQVAWVSRKVGAFRWYAAVLYPIPLCFFFVGFAMSVMRSGKTVTWKGREIRAD